MKENNTRTRDRNYLKGFKNYSSAVFDYCFVFTLLLLCFCFEFNYLLFLTDFVHEPEHMCPLFPASSFHLLDNGCHLIRGSMGALPG